MPAPAPTPERRPRRRRERPQPDPAAQLAAQPVDDASHYLVAAIAFVVGALAVGAGVTMTFGFGWALITLGALLVAFGVDQARP